MKTDKVKLRELRAELNKTRDRLCFVEEESERRRAECSSLHRLLEQSRQNEANARKTVMREVSAPLSPALRFCAADQIPEAWDNLMVIAAMVKEAGFAVTIPRRTPSPVAGVEALKAQVAGLSMRLADVEKRLPPLPEEEP